jgi:putative transposase
MTYETVRVWVARFGPLIARRLRRRRGPSSAIWHLDEMFVRIAGRRMHLWRAVDSEGEVLDMLVQSRRDKHAALRLMRKLLRNQDMAPMELITDRLRAYGAAALELGLSAEHVQGKRKNNRAESSHVPIRRRERKMQGFRSPGSAQRFLSAHAAVANTFTTCRHLISAATHRYFEPRPLSPGAMLRCLIKSGQCSTTGRVIKLTVPVALVHEVRSEARWTLWAFTRFSAWPRAQ